MTGLNISEIWIYPIKSLGGIQLQKATVQEKGLQFDRRWMLIDKGCDFMTQRMYPEMARFKLNIDQDRILVSYTNAQTITTSHSFNMSPTHSDKWITAKIWDDEVDVLEVDPPVSDWFSQHLQITCKLVAFPEEKPRPVDPRYKVKDEQVSLADAYPFLIIGQSSLDDLNKRLREPVPMNRFRPNFVFKGGDAFIEDRWRNLSIGNVRFAAVKKSARCVLTTVNQDTAEKGPEPLRTLSGYRKSNNKVNFGQYLVALDKGEIAIGNAVISD